MKNEKILNKITDVLTLLFIFWVTFKAWVFDAEPNNMDIFVIGALIWLDLVYFPNRAKRKIK